MRVWELISQLSDLPAGAEVFVKLNCRKVDRVGWLVRVGDSIGNNEPDEVAAVIMVDNVSDEVDRWKKDLISEQ